jgi:D-amino-acid dehydrogenase
MRQVDVIVLGAGIVGSSIALHLVKRGVEVALVDRRAPGEETSYGNAGIIESNTLLPYTFPSDLPKLLRIAFKRAPDTNYHLSFLPWAAPWLLAFRAASRPDRLLETARAMRPLFAQSVAEHELLLAEAGASRYLRKNGWLKLYRSEHGFAALKPQFAFAQEAGVSLRVLDPEAACELEPNLAPVFYRGVFSDEAASISNPLAVTRAYVAHFLSIGGSMETADARSLHRVGPHWQIDTERGPVAAEEAVIALGPFAPDVLDRLGIKLPLGFKRGYHRHFRPNGNAQLSRPVVDTEIGFCLAPMEQGIRLTTGAEFGARDAPPTPVQLGRLLPIAKGLFPLGETTEPAPWVGSRPCFPDSRPVIGRAPGHPGLWLAYGHAHWGLTLGPVTGRLIAEMMTGAVPFVDPAPFAAERFG